jgi:hypothetical protein
VVRNRIDVLEDFRKQLEGADVDLLREMVKVFAEQPSTSGSTRLTQKVREDGGS